jgi:hypothetical protein
MDKQSQQKVTFIKDYSDFSQTEKALLDLTNDKSFNSQFSIIGKLSDENYPTKRFTSGRFLIEDRLIKMLGASVTYGKVVNSEIGTLIVIGFLASYFLQEVEGKTLGSLSEGPYGIIRGLGFSNEETAYFIKAVDAGHFLLLIRDYQHVLNKLKKTLAI